MRDGSIPPQQERVPALKLRIFGKSNDGGANECAVNRVVCDATRMTRFYFSALDAGSFLARTGTSMRFYRFLDRRTLRTARTAGHLLISVFGTNDHNLFSVTVTLAGIAFRGTDTVCWRLDRVPVFIAFSLGRVIQVIRPVAPRSRRSGLRFGHRFFEGNSLYSSNGCHRFPAWKALAVCRKIRNEHDLEQQSNQKQSRIESIVRFWVDS
jgi:hypothetical protein